MQNKEARSLAWHKNWFRVIRNNKFTDENILFVETPGGDYWFIVK